MAFPPDNLSPEVLTFLEERHLATLTLVLPTGEPHVTPVGFMWDADRSTAQIITWQAAKKARTLAEHGPLQAALCQVDGARWLSLHGLASVTADRAINADAVRRYEQRYRPAKDRGADRRTIQIDVVRMVGKG